MPRIAPQIFKAYDIRGIADTTLDQDAGRLIGQAIGSAAIERKISKIVIGRDGRLSSPALADAVIAGLRASGVDVIDLGLVATPLVWFATHELGTGSGVMITGSHNPPEYNGIKIMLGGETLAGGAIQQLRQRIEADDLRTGAGQLSSLDIRERYLARITNDIQLASPLKLVVDAGNGAGGPFGAALYRRLGCHVRSLHCDIDGAFPNHHPDPANPDNLQDLIHALQVTDAQIGLAFDGDADRLGVVGKSGNIIFPDRLLMLFAADALHRQPGGKIVFDVKCSRQVAPWIRENHGEPVMARTGHSYMKAKMRETGALVGGELSGHFFFAERWYGFDDGIYAGARLLEILSQVEDPNALLDALPHSVATPEIQIAMAEGAAHALVEKLASAAFADALEVSRLDGLRVEYSDGFGLMRASNTTPSLILRFEGDTVETLQRIKQAFAQVLGDDIAANFIN